MDIRIKKSGLKFIHSKVFSSEFKKFACKKWIFQNPRKKIKKIYEFLCYCFVERCWQINTKSWIRRKLRFYVSTFFLVWLKLKIHYLIMIFCFVLLWMFQLSFFLREIKPNILLFTSQTIEIMNIMVKISLAFYTLTFYS